MNQSYRNRGLFWIGVLVVFAIAPMVLMLVGPRPAGKPFWRELSVALGFSGLALMSLQFALTARLHRIKEPFGSDIVYFFHHKISLVAFGLILAHPLSLFIFYPSTLGLLNLVSAPWRARAGVVSLLALIGLIVFSVYRKQLKIEYNSWRIWHGILAIAATLLALTHIFLVGNYVNTPWKRVLWILYAVAWVGILLYMRVIRPLEMMRRPWEVAEVKEERGLTWTLTLMPVGHAGMEFMPGQFAWLTAWNSPFADTENPFSFSSSAESPGRVSFTIKQLGDFTSTIKEMKPGQRVYLDGPFGAFGIDRQDHAEEFVFIAGGVGITPMMSMLLTLADRCDPRPLTLIYAGRTWDELTFREELQSLVERLNLKIHFVLEKPPEGWQGEVGFVTHEMLDRLLPKDRTYNRMETFICGPPPMMNAVEKSLLRLNIRLEDFHSERFDLV